MTTAKKISARRSASKKPPAETAAKSGGKKATAKSASKKPFGSNKGNRCWPGFEPVPGKAPRDKGSCRPEPGRHSKGTKRATQKAAAASKLEKAGKPDPKAKR